MNSRNRKDSRDSRKGGEQGQGLHQENRGRSRKGRHEQQKQEGEQGQGLHQESRDRSRKGA